MNQSRRKTLIVCSIGGMLEFYDFIIYALLATYLSSIFFSANLSPLVAVILAFSAYAVGYFTRPLGDYFRILWR